MPLPTALQRKPHDYSPSIAAYAALTGQTAASYGDVLMDAVDAMLSNNKRADQARRGTADLDRIIGDLESINATTLGESDWTTLTHALRDLEALRLELAEEGAE